MLILGVDPGTATTGFGVIEVNANRYRSIIYGTILTEASMAMPFRLGIINNRLNEIISEYKPEHMAVEQLYFSKNTRTALTVGQARGVILLTGIQKNLPIGEYTPLQVKQAVAGYGRADKQQVQKMVAAVLGLNVIPKPDDAADALAVAICHAHSYKLNSVLTGEKL
ncbi:MAG: Holliday junction resolvase [Desulfitibacter sp. BRH_c19]|nr:MAG: Holliday junction resolvase [Desulfitibacter sp. BRH_c19]